MRRWIPFAPGLALLAGCSVTIEPLALYPAVSAPPPSRAAVGVLPFQDRRPAEQRDGRKPLVVPLLVWNQRIGQWVTSSKAFTGDVSESVTRGVAEAISRGSFGGARVLAGPPGGSTDPWGAHCGEEGIRWIADGSVDDLYATLHQRAYLLLIPTPWLAGASWENRKSDPIGVARVTLRVRDCVSGANVVEREFRSEDRYLTPNLAEAARRALENVLDDIAASVAAGAGESPEPSDSLESMQPL